jgi:uncharacterized membrane protein
MFKKYLIAGLLVWIPLAITFWLLDVIVSTMDQTLLLLPPSWRPDALLPFHIPGIGLVLSLLIVLATGVLAAVTVGPMATGALALERLQPGGGLREGGYPY